MAVPEQTPYIEHTGNGVTTSFSLGFQCESKDHLIVLVDEIEPPIATWSLTGGNVVFTTAPAAGKKITLQRNTPFNRTTDYQSYNNSFRPPAVNKDFDWIWWKLQELGVADWILGARIDALKSYVDDRDDELRAYLMEEIRKQGVALDQLEEYYNYLMQRLAQIAVDKGWDASFVVDGDKNQHQINRDQREINDLLLKGTVSTYIITPETHTDISNTLNTIPVNSTVIIKNGNYVASGVEILKDNVVIECQSDATVITLTAGTNGIFMRFGKRGPATDYRTDNLPVYDGTIDYWDELEYSAASEDYPRINGSGIKGGTLILSNANGVGGSSGLDFYRCDNPVMQTKVKWSSNFTFGNGVRIHYCKDMASDYLEIDDNPSSTYAMLYYWSYGLSAGKWKIGEGSLLSIDFKHGVKSSVDELIVKGNVSVGYGSISNTLHTVDITDGELTFKASQEFDVSRDLTIRDLTINNPNGNGLVPQHVTGLVIDKYHIYARTPISISAVAFYTFSSDTGVTPSQSSAEYAFDGNYSTTKVEGSITKYYEKRPTPVLKDSKFGVGSLIISATGTQGLLLTEEGGIAASMDSNGLLRKISSVPNRGFDESKRTSFIYANTIPHAFEGVNFGDMTIKALNTGAVNSYVWANQPVINCRGKITFTGADGMAWKGLWLWDCGEDLKLNILFKRGAALSHFETNSMINTVIGGTWLCGGRVAKLIGGNATYYKDGFANHGFNVNFVYDAAPLATPPIVVDYESSQPTWKTFMSVKDSLFYRTDGVDLNTSVHQVVLWTASLAAGVSEASGGGYLSKNSYMDKNIPLRRYFTNGSADAVPPVTPNAVGELAQNGTTGTWWRANSLTTWSKL